MKVLQILPELNAGGVERGTLDLAAHLVKRGHEAWVVSNGGRLVEALESAGARHVAMPVHRKSPLTLALVPRFRRLLREIRPDILHIRSRVPGWVAWLAWRGMDRTTRPRLVSTVHGFYSVNVYSKIMTRGERVIAVSESVREYILRHYPNVAKERIRVIHRGVDPREFPYDYRPSMEWLENWRATYPGARGKFVITLPGRITRWKGQEDFLSIIADLDRAGLPVMGLLAGGPHPRKQRFFDELKSRVSETGLGDRVLFLGHRNDLREIMAVSDAVLSLSRDPEAFGRVSLEALSLGRPVIGYDHGGVAEQLAVLLPHGAVPPGDTRAVAERLRQWHQSPPYPNRDNPFTLDHMLSQTLDTYESVLFDKT